MELVVIRNTSSDRPVKLAHDRHGTVTIPPESERVVPLDFALVYLGNPNIPSDRREEEYRWTRQLWGFHPGVTPEEAWTSRVPDPQPSPLARPLPGEDHPMVGPLAPPIEVYSQDGERMFFVLDDEYGERAGIQSLARDTDTTSEEYIQRKLVELENLQKQLLAQLSARNATEVPVPSAVGSSSSDLSTSGDPGDNSAAPAKRDPRDDERVPKPASKPVGKDTPRVARSGRV